MENLAYYNGEIAPIDELKVPFLDRVSFFGDGVYDATMTHEGVILFEGDHIERFYNSCRLMEIDPGIEPDALARLLRSLVDRVEARGTFLYWQVTRGTAPRSHAFPANAKANLWVMIVPEPMADLSTDVRAVTVEDTRFYHCNAKTLNLLPNVIAQQRAVEAGADEAIFVRDGFVTECAHSNVHILKDGALITHPADNLILPGIARKHLLASCERLGVPICERPFTREELMAADEVFISMSDSFARGISHVDGIAVGGRDRDLLKLLQDDLTREFDAYIAERRR